MFVPDMLSGAIHHSFKPPLAFFFFNENKFDTCEVPFLIILQLSKILNHYTLHMYKTLTVFFVESPIVSV